MDEGWKALVDMIVSKLTALEGNIRELYAFRREFDTDYSGVIKKQEEDFNKIIEDFKELRVKDIRELVEKVKDFEKFVAEHKRKDEELATAADKKVGRFDKYFAPIVASLATSGLMYLGYEIWVLFHPVIPIVKGK
jgi:hypothetical protein